MSVGVCLYRERAGVRMSCGPGPMLDALCSLTAREKGSLFNGDWPFPAWSVLYFMAPVDISASLQPVFFPVHSLF